MFSTRAFLFAVPAFISLLFVFKVAPVMAVNEWSDITYIEGKYSRIYVDWVVNGNIGTFYCINDWMVNQSDGDVNGGLRSDEYNRFNFTMDGNDYEIRIFANGSGQIYKNGSPATLNNFRSACSWTTSPNMPTVSHAIWEFAFDVMGKTTTKTGWKGHDPASSYTVVITNPPEPPAILGTGPSAYPHYVDGSFADTCTAPILPPVPTRSHQEPVRDPWFGIFDNNNGWRLEMASTGGVTIHTRAEGAIPTVTQWGMIIMTVALLATGTIILVRRRQPVRA